MADLNFRDFKLYSYKIPLKRTLKLKGLLIDSRVGLILKIFDSDGNCGFGEIAPLPGFSRENLKDAKSQTIQICNSLKKPLSPQKPEKIISAIKDFPEDVYPSVSFGVASALLILSADRRNISLSELFNKDCSSSLEVNALLSGSKEEILASLPHIKESNYGSVKLKVGSRDLSEDIDLTRKVREQLGESINLRLDANRSWSLEQAAAFHNETKDCRIEYIEEPVSNSSELQVLLADSSLDMRVALDETLTEIEISDFKKFSSISTLVLKPTLLGLEKTISFAGLAKSQNISCVFSSSYESVLGLSIIAQLAAGNSTNSACGLDTLGIYADDSYLKLFPVENGRIEMKNIEVFDKQFESLPLSEV
ncbi:MAG: o-succinylbenzoate synthase [candidate division Zixibacteria bacterium]|nr:o-succinylbenzoate synthase [candidate division Zixibacteria bacterium]